MKNVLERIYFFIKFIVFLYLLVLMIFFSVMWIKSYYKGKDSALISMARSDIQSNIPTALRLYNSVRGAYPTTAEGLAVLVVKPQSATNWNGPYWPRGKESVEDPWGHHYVYYYPCRMEEKCVFEVYSLGPDGLENTGDDIHYHEKVADREAVKKNVVLDSNGWSEMLEGLDAMMPRDSFLLEDIHPKASGMVTMSLITPSFSNANRCLELLKESPLFDDVKFKKTHKIEEGRMEFEIACYLAEEAQDKDARSRELEVLKARFQKFIFEKFEDK